MDEALCGVWEREELSSLWDLNCLVYAGAQVVTARAKGEPEGNIPDDSTEEGEHQSEEMEDDPWGFFELFEEPDPAPGKEEPAQLKSAAASELRRYIWYLDAEKNRQKWSRKKKPTAKEAHAPSKSHTQTVWADQARPERVSTTQREASRTPEGQFPPSPLTTAKEAV